MKHVYGHSFILAFAAARSFLSWCLIFSVFRRDAAKSVAELSIFIRQDYLLLSKIVHSLWLMLHAFSVFFRGSLHRFLGAPLLLWPVDSSPNRIILKAESK